MTGGDKLCPELAEGLTNPSKPVPEPVEGPEDVQNLCIDGSSINSDTFQTGP